MPATEGLEPGDHGRLRRGPCGRGDRRGQSRGGRLKFFAEPNKSGNFVPAIGKAASVARKARRAVLIFWDYNALAARDNLKGNPKVDVIVPKSGVVAGVYVQAISAAAPHPNAAKLWLRAPLFRRGPDRATARGLLPPESASTIWSRPARRPADVLSALPPAEGYAKAKFPTLDEQKAAKEVIAKQWDTVVGATVPK